MSLNLIASRYAKSLIDLSVEQSNLENVYNDMQGLSTALESRDLYLMLKSPIIKADKKNAILKTLFEGKLDNLTMGFLNLIVKKGRENIVPEMVENFISQYKALKKVSSIKITSAVELEPSVVEGIKKELASSEHTKNEIELDVHVDPNILGGFVLQIGDKLYDASVLHQLSKLRKEFSDSSHIVKI